MEDLLHFYENLDFKNDAICAQKGGVSDSQFSSKKSSNKDLVIIEECLSQGDRKDFYKASLIDGKSIAISTLARRDMHLDPEALMREAYILSNLPHPNVIDVYDSGIDPVFGPYIAMPYIESVSLKEFLKSDPPVMEVLRLLGQFCRVVSFAHNRDVIHGDLKLDNLVVSTSGDLYLTGWSQAVATPSMDMSFSDKAFLNQVYLPSLKREQMYAQERNNFAKTFTEIADALPNGRAKSHLLLAANSLLATTEQYPIRKLLKIVDSVIKMKTNEPVWPLKYAVALVASLFFVIWLSLPSAMIDTDEQGKISYILKSSKNLEE